MAFVLSCTLSHSLRASSSGAPRRPRQLPVRVLSENGRRRVNEMPDAMFYAQPRFQPADVQYLAALNALHAQVIPGPRVFDLGASCYTPLDQCDVTFVEALGLNAAEMDVNTSLHNYMIRDLNATPFVKLPVPSMYFDAVICNDVVPYLIQPELVFREMRRILRLRGVLVVSFSDSYFWDKAIAAWKEATPDARLQLVQDLIVKSTAGAFQVIRVMSSQQPLTKCAQFGKQCKHASSQPLYAVVAKRRS